MPRAHDQVRPGAGIATRMLTPVAGSPLSIPDPERLLHLQFRRFAGCPVCNLHLRSVARRHDEIAAAGVLEVAVFHSPAAELARYAGELPFALVADPDKALYAEFGVESAPRALLDPRVTATVLRAVARSTWAALLGRDRPPKLRQRHGRLGLPGDFLIAPDGTVLAAKYGEHAYDQWSVDELLEIVSGARDSAGHPAPSGRSPVAST